MDKVLDFVMAPRFITGAIAGGAITAGALIIFVGDINFFAFWALIAVGAGVGGAIMRKLP